MSEQNPKCKDCHFYAESMEKMAEHVKDFGHTYEREKIVYEKDLKVKISEGLKKTEW